MGRRKRSVVERARTRSARIATGTAWARLHRGSRAAFCGYGEHRKLRGELLALAFRARGFVLAENERFKLVLAFLADVLEDRHLTTPDKFARSAWKPALRSGWLLFKIRWWRLR